MKAFQIFEGQLHSPYFIFIECGGRYTDEELLDLLGIDGYVANPEPTFHERSLAITDDGRWTHVADDWSYSLWHSKKIRGLVAELGKVHNIFTCSVGDSDQSFDFAYYHASILRRRYVVDDRHYQGGSVTENYGTPLPGEDEALRDPSEMCKIMKIAASLGIQIDYTKLALRCYAKPGERRSILDRVLGR
jgi:hypothetical protein